MPQVLVVGAGSSTHTHEVPALVAAEAGVEREERERRGYEHAERRDDPALVGDGCRIALAKRQFAR
jgi:hypothetical protein